jgi:hypothetical protein
MTPARVWCNGQSVRSDSKQSMKAVVLAKGVQAQAVTSGNMHSTATFPNLCKTMLCRKSLVLFMCAVMLVQP